MAREKWLTADEIRLIRKLAREGHSYREIGARLGRSHSVGRVVKAAREGGRIRLVEWCPGGRRLSLTEREEIHLGLARGESFSAIARRLGRSVSTVSREVNANGGRAAYRASKAYRRSFDRARRPKTPKLAGHPPLRAVVEEWLGEWWSPEQIARRLRGEFPHDPMMWVSRDDLPGDLCPGTGVSAPRTGPVSAHREGPPQASGAHGPPRAHPRHGPHQ